MCKQKVLDYIQNNNLIGVKAGIERPDFLDIWMVVVQGRIFARSWGLAERSWYNSFLKKPMGQIKCGTILCQIWATVVDDTPELTAAINQAYLAKYNQGYNSVYAQSIIAEKHVAKTMEFMIDEFKSPVIQPNSSII
ncbi:DUF2255 family protein [Sphingobacterium sp. BIGb0165]|uniref:DUF2255 family protein n=1 Tax=Sphingobacterium sp. BIGb0165 TaxID=2940615 RepID=UPI00216843F8|nr:DUF2255 family protein [Sphingobacterium sp. BIGb0165]MCS4225457.1 hypothetical protein [Sphingobacterium sp. BIGb0165]